MNKKSDENTIQNRIPEKTGTISRFTVAANASKESKSCKYDNFFSRYIRNDTQNNTDDSTTDQDIDDQHQKSFSTTTKDHIVDKVIEKILAASLPEISSNKDESPKKSKQQSELSLSVLASSIRKLNSRYVIEYRFFHFEIKKGLFGSLFYYALVIFYWRAVNILNIFWLLFHFTPHT